MAKAVKNKTLGHMLLKTVALNFFNVKASLVNNGLGTGILHTSFDQNSKVGGASNEIKSRLCKRPLKFKVRSVLRALRLQYATPFC